MSVLTRGSEHLLPPSLAGKGARGLGERRGGKLVCRVGSALNVLLTSQWPSCPRKRASRVGGAANARPWIPAFETVDKRESPRPCASPEARSLRLSRTKPTEGAANFCKEPLQWAFRDSAGEFDSPVMRRARKSTSRSGE